MRTLILSVIGGLTLSGALLLAPQNASAQYYGYRYGPRPAYGYYGYVPARRYYRSRAWANRRYGTYWDVYGGRPATLGYCQRNPGRCM